MARTDQPPSSFLEKVSLKKMAKKSTWVILRKTNHQRHVATAEEEEEDVGPRGQKRKRPERRFRSRKARTQELSEIETRALEAELGIRRTAEEEEDIIFGEVVGPSAPAARKRKRTPKKRGKGRKPTLKSKLLKRLRAKRKIQKAKLRQTERDINSLVCRRKKAE